MTYLVLGGTGTVGSAVVDGLQEEGGEVRVLTRSAEKAEGLPDGVQGVVGDLLDPATYDDAFDGVDRLFLLNAVAPTELQEGVAAVNEALRAGVEHVVHLSVQDVEKGPHIPHFASKIGIERAIRETGLPHTILRPSNFFQNDHWFREAIVEHGVYPQPLGDVGVSRVDVRDIADATVNAFARRGPEDRAYALVGPDPLTGEACARIWGEALGREVAYGGNDLEAWQEAAARSMPLWMVYDFRIMYALFQTEGLVADRAQLDQTRAILGREPRSFEAFAEEAAESWRDG